VMINPKTDKFNFSQEDTALVASLSVVTREQKKLTATPVFLLKDEGQVEYLMDTVISQGLSVGFSGIKPEKKIEIKVKESAELVPYLALKVLQFPFIKLVWLGTVLMVIGFIMSLVRRIQLLK